LSFDAAAERLAGAARIQAPSRSDAVVLDGARRKLTHLCRRDTS
jgi:hypothetical protein